MPGVARRPPLCRSGPPVGPYHGRMIRLEHVCVLDGARGWVTRFTGLGRPGGMCEVLVPGMVRAGDEVTVPHRPAHGLTLGEAFGRIPAEKAAALLAAYAPADVQPDVWRRAQAAVAR